MRKSLLYLFVILLYVSVDVACAEETGSIEGELLMLDDMTPHVAVVVQAIMVDSDGPSDRPSATTLSDERGQYRFVNLKPGWYQVRCYTLNGYVYYRAAGDALRVTRYEEETSELITEEDAGEILHIERGKTLKDIDFRFAPFKKGTWRNITYPDGLAGNQINAIYSDPDGVMWFGTESGVSRYDGKEFVNFTTDDGLVGVEVWAIHRDPDGAMWFGTRGGVSRYDGKEFVNFTTEDGLAGNRVNDIHRDPDGVMWFGTDGGVSRYDGKEFVNFTTEDGLANNVVRAIHRNTDGVMWFGTDGGVSRYDGREFINLTTEDGLVNNIAIAIHRDTDGMMWFGTYGGVSCYDGKGFVNLTTGDGLASDAVQAIHSDADGVIWFGTGTREGKHGEGVSRYDGKGFTNFTTEDGLANNIVYAIHGDLEGVLWFGTEGGASRYDHKTLVNFSTKDGLANNIVYAMHGDPEGILWFGTEGGVSRYDGKGFVNFTTKDGLVNNSVGSIHRDPDGMMWFGTSWRGGGGVSHYDGKRFVNLTIENGLASDSVRDIYRDSDGVMWFGTRDGGISRYDGKEFVNFTTEDGLVNNWVRDIHGAPDGIMWFGTGGGISRYDGNEFVNLTTKDGLAHNSIKAIHRDPDGMMWFGTGDGVSRYDGKKFVNLGLRDGLVHNVVAAIHRDPDDVMWFGTVGGLSCYDGTAWSSLDTRDGLAGNFVDAIHQDQDGYLWFATESPEGGVSRYRPNTTPPKVHIVSVTTDQTYRDLSAIPAFAPGTRITIEYSALDFKTVLEKRQYRYRIKEIDSDWRKPTKEVTFDHTYKEPGTYTFEVQAIDRDLNYSEPASLEITILPPPFYTRAGFIIGMVLVAFFIPSSVLAAVVIRQRRQEFEPISNPYIVGNPIRSKDMFFGRKSDFEFIRIKLGTEEAGLVIVFAGARRSGKTSILFQILDGELGERLVPVLLDMQAMTVDDEPEFFERLASGINEALVESGDRPASADFRGGNPTRAFEGFISEVMTTLEGRGLLLLFDEYELIESKIDDGVLRPDIVTFFAGLLEAQPRLSFIFTGSRHLEQRNISYWRVLIGKSLYRHISFLSERDALRLITEPVADQVIYPRGIPERIVRLTAGQPFYTQVVCQNMMDRLNEVERNRVRQEDVDAVAQELADNPLPQMIYFWDGLAQEQKDALSLLGEVLEDSNGYASAQALINFTQEQNLKLGFELSVLERVLNDVFVSEILERERAGEGQYEYRFRVDLFRLWTRQAHSVWE